MKQLLFCALLCPLTAHANPLLGSWQFVKGQYATNDGMVEASAPQISSVKLLTDNHFSYITQQNGAFRYAGGGRYRLENGHFIETVSYGNLPSLLGKTLKFSYRIEGNLWHHRLQQDGKLVEYEVWRKLD